MVYSPHTIYHIENKLNIPIIITITFVIIHEGKSMSYRSSACRIRSTAPPRPLSSITRTAGGTSSKEEWARKSRLIILEKNSKDMYSVLMEDLTMMALPWSKVSSPMAESDSSSLQAPRDIVHQGKVKEREGLSGDALLDQTLLCSPAPSPKRVKKIFQDWLILSSQEDLVPRELQKSESFLVFLKPRVSIHLLWSRRMLSEEPSRAKRMKMPLSGKKPLKSKDWWLMPDSEERESSRRLKLGDGRELLLQLRSTRKFMTNGWPRERLQLIKPSLPEKPPSQWTRKPSQRKWRRKFPRNKKRNR